MKVKNVSGEDRIVTPPNAEPFAVAAGDTVEVDDKLGKSLTAQEANWSQVGSKKETK